MSIKRISKTSALLGSFILALQACAAVAQERPGIRMFVNPPEDCSVSETVDTENLYSFIRAQIQALSLAQTGEKANVRVLEGAPAGQTAETIAGLRKERIENTCASFVISQYSGSKNPTIATAARFLTYAYDELGQMSNQMLGFTLQESLQKTVGPSPLGQLSKLMEKRRGTLGNMAVALNLSLDLLIDKSRTDPGGKPDHLIVASAQLKDLLGYLDSRFPSLKANEGTGSSGDFARQAASIRAFLTSGYRPADLP